MTEAELYWLAGYLEGEGSFSPCSQKSRAIRISVSSKDREPIEKCAKLFQANVVETSYRTRVGRDEKPLYSTACQKEKNVLPLMYALAPIMSPRRVLQIMNCFSHYGNWHG